METRANHQLDNDAQVFFYEHEFYVLSNFSSFSVYWKGHRFATSEAAYHWEKFPDDRVIQTRILEAKSAHDALMVAYMFKAVQRPDWDSVKVSIMKEILLAKVLEHEYVHRKLMETGKRELIENSWRDNFWGCGPNKDGQNIMGKLWMEIRSELAALQS